MDDDTSTTVSSRLGLLSVVSFCSSAPRSSGASASGAGAVADTTPAPAPVEARTAPSAASCAALAVRSGSASGGVPWAAAAQLGGVVVQPRWSAAARLVASTTGEWAAEPTAFGCAAADWASHIELSGTQTSGMAPGASAARLPTVSSGVCEVTTAWTQEPSDARGGEASSRPAVGASSGATVPRTVAGLGHAEAVLLPPPLPRLPATSQTPTPATTRK